MEDVDKVAKYFLWKAAKEKRKISNKKLQKLLYYAQAWYLAIKNRPLFKDEIEAWIHGPTVRSVYNNFKKFGFNPITTEVNEKDLGNLRDDELLNDVWQLYGKYDADYLEALTHNEKPWQTAREGLEFDESSDNIISQDSMKEYYKSLFKKIKNAE
ncbi:DUF4065 domain-containing protein [Patescibacteria group bacterium]|nr:DUF4065 domain-containing protein [Patescibacteria group bacterium]MBU4017254.1 DUF4065 domain-containing protein [Patescibacteria group bacterium]MBU4099189.1 DUF4065 domain-containing protein [Patescibacteria group bacterium]